MYVLFTIFFAGILFGTWGACLLPNAQMQNQPTASQLQYAIAEQAGWEAGEEAYQYFKTNYYLYEDVTKDVKLAAALGFFGNTICCVFYLLTAMFAMFASARKMIECQRNSQSLACLPCCI